MYGSFNDVAADDIAFVGGDGRELRRVWYHVSADVNVRIGCGSQEGVDMDQPPSVIQGRRGKIESEGQGTLL